MELYRQIHTVEEIECWARSGWIDVNRLNNVPTRHRLTSREQQLFERAKADRFLTGRYSNDCRNLWWYYCNARGWPFIVVRHARKYADIWVDVLSTLGCKLPERDPCAVDLLLRLLEKRPKDPSRRAGAFGGQGGVSIYDIPIQLSSEIAAEVRDVIFPMVRAQYEARAALAQTP